MPLRTADGMNAPSPRPTLLPVGSPWWLGPLYPGHSTPNVLLGGAASAAMASRQCVTLQAAPVSRRNRQSSLSKVSRSTGVISSDTSSSTGRSPKPSPSSSGSVPTRNSSAVVWVVPSALTPTVGMVAAFTPAVNPQSRVMAASLSRLTVPPITWALTIIWSTSSRDRETRR